MRKIILVVYVCSLLAAVVIFTAFVAVWVVANLIGVV